MTATILLILALILFLVASFGGAGLPTIYRLQTVALGLACVVASMLVPLL